MLWTKIMKHCHLALLSLGPLVQAADLLITIPASPPILDNPATLPSSTHATLLSADDLLTARLSQSNTLFFPDLAPGSYLLDIHTKDFIFPPYRVDVGPPPSSQTESHTQGQTQTRDPDERHAFPSPVLTVHATFRGNEWSNLGPRIASSTAGSQSLQVSIQAVARKQFYTPRAGFSLFAFFKSPMILMGLFTCVVVFGFPKIMDSIDPETKAEMEEMQREMLGGGSTSNPASRLQNFDLASWMAGKGDTAKDSGATKPGQEPSGKIKR